MSHGGPHPGSSAQYIIICSGRIRAQAAKSPEAKIVAASDCAAQLCSFIESKHDVGKTDFALVSTLQQGLMDGMVSISKEQAEAKVAELFVQLDELEQKFSEHEY